MKQKIKNIVDASVMIPLLAIGAIICVEGVIAFNIPLALLSFSVMVVSAARLIGDVEGNFIKKSIFSVSRNGKITQDTLRHPLKFLKILGNKNKMDLLIKEEYNMFKQLKRCDSKGNIINYNTLSQGLTVKLLKDLEKLGYIENLEYAKSRKSSLMLEKLLIGNNSKSKNKKNLYNITFNVTDKQISDDVLFSLNSSRDKNVYRDNSGLDNKGNQDKINNNSHSDSDSTLSRQKKIDELKRMRENLVGSKKDDTNYKTI